MRLNCDDALSNVDFYFILRCYIEQAQATASVLQRLKQGNEALKTAQAGFSLEDVQGILADMDDVKEHQADVDRLIADSLTEQDDDAIEAELAALEEAEKPADAVTTRVQVETTEAAAVAAAAAAAAAAAVAAAPVAAAESVAAAEADAAVAAGVAAGATVAGAATAAAVAAVEVVDDVAAAAAAGAAPEDKEAAAAVAAAAAAVAEELPTVPGTKVEPLEAGAYTRSHFSST